MQNLLRIEKMDSKIRKGFLFALFLLLTSYLITLYNNKTLEKGQNMVSHTYEVLNTLEEFSTAIVDAETGTRGYVITGNGDFLEPFYESSSKIKIANAQLEKLLLDNPEQLKIWNNIQRLGKKRVLMLENAIAIFRNNGLKITDSLKQFSPISNGIMDSVRSEVKAMQKYENVLLEKRKSLAEKYSTWLDIITFISLSLAMAFIAFGFLTYQKEHKQRKSAYKKIQDFQDKLTLQVNELNRINAELVIMKSQEKFAATGRMARQIAHEIRNPLTNINLAASQLSDDLNIKDEDHLYLFDMINRNSDRINNLVSDLLNSTKFAELKTAQYNVNTIIDEALLEAKDRIELNNIEVKKEFSNSLPYLLLDKDKMKLVFTNLIINGIEACEKAEKPMITISTKKGNNNVVIDVNDNGIGLDEENLNKIFEPYFTTKLKGNGLGLTNTQNIVFNHKGQISVASKLNEGTTFKIQLPLGDV